MIRIIAGTFGWTGSGRLEVLNAKSGSRALPPEVESRLVAAGVAAYVREDVSAMQAFPDSHAVLPPGVPAFTESMSKAQLASAMDDVGLRRKESMTKQQMLKKLAEFYRT